MSQDQGPVLIDGMQCPDVFCSGIARIERLEGGCFRFIIYTEQSSDSGMREWLIVSKLVVPASALPRAIRQASLALAGPGVMVEKDLASLLN